VVKRVITDEMKMHKLDRLAVVTDGNSSTTWGILPSNVTTGVDSASVPSPSGLCDLPRQGIRERPLTVSMERSKRVNKKESCCVDKVSVGPANHRRNHSKKSPGVTDILCCSWFWLAVYWNSANRKN
jgi:hypothetical protein